MGVDIDPVNWGWLCDKGRFDFEAQRSDDRLTEPWSAVGDAAARRPLGRRARAAAAVGDPRRAGPDRVAVIGGARLTNEDAYAWAKLAKGVHRHRPRRRPARRRPAGRARARSAAAPPSTRCAPTGGTVVLLGPDVKEELPVLFLRLRDAVVDHGVRVDRDLAPRPAAHAARRRVAAPPSGRGRRRWCARCSTGRRPAPTPAASTQPRLPRAQRPARGRAGHRGRRSAVPRRVGRRGRRRGRRAAGRASPTRGSCRRCGGPTCTARSTWVWHRASSRAASPSTPAATWFSSPLAERAPATGARHDGHPAGGRVGRDRRARAARRRPARRLPRPRPGPPRPRRRRSGDRGRPVPHRPSTEAADVVLPAAGFTEVEGTTTNLEGRVSAGSARRSPARHRPRRLDHRRRARRVPSAPTSASTRSAAIRAEIGRGGPGARGRLSHRALDGATDGVVVPLAATEADGVPALVTFARRPRRLEPPALDRYSLRLVRLAQALRPGRARPVTPRPSRVWRPARILRVNPYDFDRLGVAAGDAGAPALLPRRLARRRSPPTRACRAAPPPSTSTSPGCTRQHLIDAAERVTDVRVETGGT